MNPAIYLFILIIFLVVIPASRRKRLFCYRLMSMKGRDGNLKEFAERFIGSECLITVFDTQINGTITEVRDDALLVENKSGVEAVNLSYVSRIREYPKSKNGKK